jgi:catechol 2,3-dioxygenase-like lactoylglutathione lyase family enzyme
MASVLDHLDLNVSDLERSRSFYGPLLEHLGYAPFQEGSGWCSFIDPAGLFYLVLVQAPIAHMQAGFHRKRIGVNHLAFSAPSRAAVDDFHSLLLANRIAALYGAPMEMGERYAVFFEDPDRLKIEVVFRPDAPISGP